MGWIGCLLKGCIQRRLPAITAKQLVYPCVFSFLPSSSSSSSSELCLYLWTGIALSAASRMPATTAETLSLVTRTVCVAPLVLLSVADHYGRSAKGTRKRVVGVLLGENTGQKVRVLNSFAGTRAFLQKMLIRSPLQPRLICACQCPLRRMRRTLLCGFWTTTSLSR